MLSVLTDSPVISCPHCQFSFPVSEVIREYYDQDSYAERCPYCGEYL
jgi:DNA-directed RNA polymerase subunit RPC12/RpoP